jgi:hypothetical protein
MADRPTPEENSAYWRGYSDAITDVERASTAGKAMSEWVKQVRAKFHLVDRGSSDQVRSTN